MQKSKSVVPKGSMYGIYLSTFTIKRLNVCKYTSPVDFVGLMVSFFRERLVKS